MQKTNSVNIAEKVSPACLGKSILLIDADELNHQLHQAQLSRYGINLICSKSLRHALWIVQENPPDLILTEIFFNGHLNYEHIFLLQKEKLLPIIIQTCQHPRKHSENCKIRGAVAYFTKPLNWKQYTESIFEYLEKEKNND